MKGKKNRRMTFFDGFNAALDLAAARAV